MPIVKHNTKIYRQAKPADKVEQHKCFYKRKNNTILLVIPKEQLETDSLHISAVTEASENTTNFKSHSICTMYIDLRKYKCLHF